MISVLIQRVIAPGMEPSYDQIINSAMQSALSVPGFISGESMHNLEYPNVRYVMVKMRSELDWYAWHASPERNQALEQVTPLLLEPEKITLLSH
ncbi:antibiotic biosynthesis monooxygenase [bacterium SCSIO 12696]|nr:antibiotic biosynthesis monooxygenase [bacterium SCSIO 12696]